MPSNLRCTDRQRHARGFTLVELMITLVVFGIVIAAVAAIVLRVSKNHESTSQRVENAQMARAAIDFIARDVRSAGYGVDAANPAAPQPAIAYVDSTEIIISENLSPWPDTLSARRLAPQAYDPAGSPKPATLTSTSWTPPVKYRTGAELVRYTLDVNNDGVVDGDDISVPQGSDAASTPNPDDYVLVREVYGDSTSNTAGNNGGAQERVALIHRPGNGVPPIYTVYMRGSATPWDWHDGPVPATQLQDIERVEVRVTTASQHPDANGAYGRTTLTAQVNAMRSVPNWGVVTYAVTGYVFDDVNRDNAKGSTESGLSGVTVRLGNYVGYTTSTGYYAIRVPDGTYRLRHEPPAGYGVFTQPDSFSVTVASAAVSRSFADTARQGGWVSVHVWNDANGNHTEDTGEAGLTGVTCQIQPGAATAYTDLSGNCRLFAPAAGYSISCTVPDTMTATTSNPVTGTMTNGGTGSVSFGLLASTNGTIRGSVFRDNNRNGVPDGGEAGLANVWVGATTDGGLNVQGYAYTDASGNYTLTVPANDPPHTRAYSVFLVPPAGFFPTNSTSIGSLWLQANQVLTGKNFGMSSYQVISLSANRVLSLAAADLVEGDWNGNQTQNARWDTDLILGADAGGTDNVSVWFNQYATSPLFAATPTRAWQAPNSVVAMALDTLDGNDQVRRPDLVTGTKLAANGNFFVWLTQGSRNNEGYFPTTYSTGMNYRTTDGGDVQSVLTFDCSGGNRPDIIVGTKSPTTGRGTVEVWQNSNAATPTFVRQEVYPTAGSVPGGIMGEVTAMALADFDGDGLQDLVVGTRTSSWLGEVIFFKNCGRVNGNRFIWRNTITLFEGAATSLGVLDVDRDGQQDLVVGIQRNTSQGRLLYLRNKHNITSWGFDRARTVDAPGIVLSLRVADLGGNTVIPDLAVGWRASESGYGGGVSIYYMDLLNLPSNGVDPSNGSIVNMVPASTSANFNYGLNTTAAPSPYLTDLAVGVKSGAATGALVVFIR